MGHDPCDYRLVSIAIPRFRPTIKAVALGASSPPAAPAGRPVGRRDSDAGVRGGAEGATYHAAAAGAGAACEGARLYLPTCNRSERPTTRLPTSQAEERPHRKPKPGQRSEAVAAASDGRAQPRAQWSRFGLSGACAGCRQARQTSGGARTGVGRGEARRARRAGPAGASATGRGQTGPANSERVAPVERFAASECPRPVADVVGMMCSFLVPVAAPTSTATMYLDYVP